MKRHDQITFRPYSQGQMMLPTSLDEMIPAGDLVRVVSEVVDQLKMNTLSLPYKGGGTSGYDPRVLLKIILYAYTQKIYGSRQMVKAVRENVHFMWLAGENRPDFRTLNRFRSGAMAEIVDAVSANVLEYLAEHGYVSLKTYFLDGTKLLADANRHQVTWAKNVARYKAKVQEKIAQLLAEARAANAAEEAEYGNRDLEEVEAAKATNLNSEELKKRVSELNEHLAEMVAKTPATPETKKLVRVAKALEQECLPRLERYEHQEETLNGRNSYAKTDEDSTFMRMKEDRLGTGTLKPAYNVQIGTENQIIVGFSVHQNASDSTCLISHLETVAKQTKQLPERIVTDAGYGSEQNYVHLEKAGIDAYVKYATFDKETKPSFKKKRLYHVDTWTYDEDNDEYLCPQGRRLRFRHITEEKSSTGYVAERRRYECLDCSGCPVADQCHSGKGNRSVQVSPELIRLRAQAAQRLRSEEGRQLRIRRCIEPESVHGHLKHNRGFRRFHVRGLAKVHAELGLLCMAHNMRKIAA